MGSVGFSIEMKRIGNKKGDAREMFFAIKELMLEQVWNVAAGFAGFTRYLNSENLNPFMEDRYDGNDRRMWFAWWEDDVEDPIVVDYAIHLACSIIVKGAEDYQALAAEHGFALTLEDEGAFRGRYVKHGTSICKLKPWSKKRAITKEAEYVACKHRGAGPSSKVDKSNYRVAAMTAICACPFCKYPNKALLAGKIPEAWAALVKDKKGIGLLDEPAVLADWFEDKGIALSSAQVAAIAGAFKEAE